MATYFSRGSRPFCPVTGQDHRTVSAYKCPGCGLSNPNLRPRSPPPPDAEVIDVGDDTPERARPPAQALLPSGPIPPRGSRKATYLPSIPGLLLGHAEEERDRANQREADRKTKTGFKAPSTHTIHFAIGLARHSADEGWAIWLDDHTWSISLADKELTDEGFLLELHQTLITLNSRSIVKPWLTPKKEGNWLLSTQNPKKGTSEITHWIGSRLLSEVIDEGVYFFKNVGNKKVYSLWLCWRPKPESDEDSSSPSPVKKKTPRKTLQEPPQRAPPSVKKEIKEEIKREIKEEVKQDAKPKPGLKAVATPNKRPRAVSAEMSIRKRPGTRAARKADNDELPSVREIITSAEADASNVGEGSEGGESHEGDDEGGEGEEVAI